MAQFVFLGHGEKGKKDRETEERLVAAISGGHVPTHGVGVNITAFRAPSRFSVKMSCFFCVFCIDHHAMYLFVLFCVCLFWNGADLAQVKTISGHLSSG